MRKLVLRRRSGMQADKMEQAMLLQTAALPYSSFVGMKSMGPQLVACCYLPPADRYPGHPDYKPAPPAKLRIQVTPSQPILRQFARLDARQAVQAFCLALNSPDGHNRKDGITISVEMTGNSSTASVC